MTTSMTRFTNQFHAAVILVTLRVAHLIYDLLARIEPEVSSHCSQQPPSGPYPRKMNPFHTLTPCFPKNDFNLILPATARFSKWSLTLQHYCTSSIFHITASHKKSVSLPFHISAKRSEQGYV